LHVFEGRRFYLTLAVSFHSVNSGDGMGTERDTVLMPRFVHCVEHGGYSACESIFKKMNVPQSWNSNNNNGLPYALAPPRRLPAGRHSIFVQAPRRNHSNGSRSHGGASWRVKKAALAYAMSRVWPTYTLQPALHSQSPPAHPGGSATIRPCCPGCKSQCVYTAVARRQIINARKSAEARLTCFDAVFLFV
jgi:hypothetical protein